MNITALLQNIFSWFKPKAAAMDDEYIEIDFIADDEYFKNEKIKRYVK